MRQKICDKGKNMNLVLIKKAYTIADLAKRPIEIRRKWDENDKEMLLLESHIIKLMCKREALLYRVPELEGHLFGYYCDYPELGLILEAFEEITDGPFGSDDAFVGAPHITKWGYKDKLNCTGKRRFCYPKNSNS